MLRIVFSFLALLTMAGISAQAHKAHLDPCGVTERHPFIDAYQRGEIATVRSSAPMTLPLRLHIVGRSDGSGYADWNQLFAAINLLNEDFATADINFCIDGEIDFINNSNYYEHDFNSGSTMMAFNDDPGVINVYFVGDPSGACGYYNIPRDALAMNNDCLGSDDHTFGHEMGHYLSLPHTFDGWEGEIENFSDLPTNTPAPSFVGGRPVERADGSNCETAGDGFCDTSADYISNRWPCNGGVFGDSLMDPTGDRFVVPGFPIMGYAFDNCVERFTDDQRDAMVANAVSRTDLDHPFVANAEPANPDDIDIVSPLSDFEAVDELEVTLEWTAAANADFYIVQISTSPFFGSNLFAEILTTETSLTLTGDDDDIEIGERYRWRIRPVSNCNVGASNNFTGVNNFRITDLVSNTLDAELNAAISVYPNPVTAGQNLIRVSATDLPTSDVLSVELIGTDGRLLNATQDISASGGRFQYDMPTTNLAAGIYFIRIQQAERLVTRRIVVTK